MCVLTHGGSKSRDARPRSDGQTSGAPFFHQVFGRVMPEQTWRTDDHGKRQCQQSGGSLADGCSRLIDLKYIRPAKGASSLGEEPKSLWRNGKIGAKLSLSMSSLLASQDQALVVLSRLSAACVVRFDLPTANQSDLRD